MEGCFLLLDKRPFTQRSNTVVVVVVAALLLSRGNGVPGIDNCPCCMAREKPHGSV